MTELLFKKLTVDLYFLFLDMFLLQNCLEQGKQQEAEGWE